MLCEVCARVMSKLQEYLSLGPQLQLDSTILMQVGIKEMPRGPTEQRSGLHLK